MDEARQQIQTWWQGLARWQQVAAVAVAVGGLALLFYLTILAQTPEYAVAYSGLSQEDAALVVEALKKAGVPYQIDGDGSVIRVPAARLHETRLDLARQGLPKGGTIGFEIFDGGQLSNLGMTEFMQKVNYQRALEGELARTIAALDPLQAARVHVVLPEPSLFLEEQKEPTASVLVQLKPGRRLEPGQIEAITNLVASSVEGLKPEAVTVVDVAGNVLSSQAQAASLSPMADMTTTQIELQRMVETETQSRLQRLLDKTLGPDKAAVQVSVTLDWDRLEMSSETYTPANAEAGVVRSSRVVEEYQGAPGETIGGVPGVDSNSLQIPSYQTVISGTTGAGLKREAVYNYEVSKTTQNLVKAPGSIKRMSVALMLDESIPEEQRQSIQDMVAAAAGLDTGRGDTIALAATAFDRSFYIEQQKALADAQRHELMVTGVKAAGSILGLLLLLLFVRSLFRDITARRVAPRMTVLPQEQAAAFPLPAPAPTPQLPGGQETPALAAGAPAEEAPALAEQAAEEVEDELDIASLKPAPSDDARYLRHLAAISRDDPEAIVEVIESWLRED